MFGYMKAVCTNNGIRETYLCNIPKVVIQIHGYILYIVEFAAFESVVLNISTDRGKIVNKVMLSACGKYIYYFTRDKIHEQAAVKRIHIRFREIVLIHG